MKKYNISNYVRYKEDLKSVMPKDKPYEEYTRNEMIVKFMPLVEKWLENFQPVIKLLVYYLYLICYNVVTKH